MDLVREHFEEHPEEYVGIKSIKQRSETIQGLIDTARANKRAEVERWKKIYAETHGGRTE